jgi:hypothetical protein
MSCFQAQVNAQNAGMPELAIAAVLFIIAAIAGFAAKASAKDAEKKWAPSQTSSSGLWSVTCDGALDKFDSAWEYDGVDLPGDACHVLVIDGLPEALDGIERVDAAQLSGTSLPGGGGHVSGAGHGVDPGCRHMG